MTFPKEKIFEKEILFVVFVVFTGTTGVLFVVEFVGPLAQTLVAVVDFHVNAQTRYVDS